jgi:hypothetical protein
VLGFRWRVANQREADADMQHPGAGHNVGDLGQVDLRYGGEGPAAAAVVRTVRVPKRKDSQQPFRRAALLSEDCTIRSPAHMRRQNGYCGEPPSLAGHAAVQCTPQIRCTHQHGPTTSAGPPVRSGSALNVDAPSRL